MMPLPFYRTGHARFLITSSGASPCSHRGLELLLDVGVRRVVPRRAGGARVAVGVGDVLELLLMLQDAFFRYRIA
jgi:hypothetical protein